MRWIGCRSSCGAGSAIGAQHSGRTALERVTTASLEALSLYSQGVRAGNAGYDDKATAAFEAAIRIDSTFASAYRGLAIAYGNWGANERRRAEAFVRTYELRDRLPERERLLAEAGYHSEVDYQPERAIAATTPCCG